MIYKALIIEDSPDFAELLCAILERLGHEGVVVTNRQDALYRLDEEEFDFVLLDLSLPTHEKDTNPLPYVGFELLAHIRKRFDSEMLPVIGMTAYEKSAQTGVQVMKAGADDYFSKGDTAASPEEKIKLMLQSIREDRLHMESKEDEAAARRKPHYVAFQGDLVFVNGIEIENDKWIEVFQLLRRLTARSGGGMTAEDLAEDLSVHVQPNTVRKWIGNIRDFLAEEHREQELGELGRNDIIKNPRGKKGYTFNMELCDFSFDCTSETSVGSGLGSL